MTHLAIPIAIARHINIGSWANPKCRSFITDSWYQLCRKPNDGRQCVVGIGLIKQELINDAHLKAVKVELIYSGLIASLPKTKNTALIDIAKEMYLREIF